MEIVKKKQVLKRFRNAKGTNYSISIIHLNEKSRGIGVHF